MLERTAAPLGCPMFEIDFTRTLILGNSGSGKSWLAARLAVALGAQTVDLDSVHWEPGNYNHVRDKKIAIEMVRQAALENRWVIEGVYGWLAQEAISRATALIWLDISVAECLANLRRRDRRGDEASFSALLAWAADYRRRQTSSSFSGHQRLFDAFPGRKLRLDSRRAVDRFLITELI